MPQRSESEHQGCPKNLAVIQDGRVISGCELCINSRQQQGVSATYERNWQARQHAKDIIQPNQPDKFAKAYPKEAREAGYTDEMMRKYG